jgi:lambda family phage portal protein
MSVEVDQDEKPVAYYLTTPYYDVALYPQGTRLLRRVRVPASEMIYLAFTFDDESATRSQPAAHAAMRNLRELGAFIEAKVIASRVEACQMGFLIPPETDEVSPLDGPAASPGKIDAEPAVFPELPPGWDLKMFSPHNPNGQEGEFLKAMLKGVAVGFDVDYPTFASDLREVNFSSIRAGIQEAREVYKYWQQYFIEHLHREVYLAWLRSSLMTGAVEGMLARDFERVTEPRWLPRGWGYVNPLQDVEADAKRVLNSFTTRTAVAADEGVDFEEVLQTLKAEGELAAKYGIELVSSEQPGAAQPQPAPADGAGNAADGG